MQEVNVQANPNVVMRVWIDPEKLAAYGLAPSDVYNAMSNKATSAP